MRLHGRADYARHESKVRGEPVIEAVHHIAQEAARARLVPRLGALAGEIGERPGVGGRFLGELERDFLRVGKARFPVEVEVPLHLFPLLPQQHRQQIARPEAAAEPGPQPSVQRGLGVLDRVAVFSEELAPHLHVPLLDPGKLDVDVLAVGIGLLSGEGQIEVGRIGFILPVMQPFLYVGWGHAASYYAATP